MTFSVFDYKDDGNGMAEDMKTHVEYLCEAKNK